MKAKKNAQRCNLVTCAIAALEGEFSQSDIANFRPSGGSVNSTMLADLESLGLIESCGSLKEKGKKEKKLWRKTAAWKDPEAASCTLIFAAAEKRAKDAGVKKNHSKDPWVVGGDAWFFADPAKTQQNASQLEIATMISSWPQRRIIQREAACV